MLALYFLAAALIALAFGGYFLILDSRRRAPVSFFTKALLVGSGALAIVVLIYGLLL